MLTALSKITTELNTSYKIINYQAMEKDVKTAAFVILEKYLDATDENVNKEQIVNAMIEYADLRLSKLRVVGVPSDESSSLHKHGVNVRFNSELRDKFFKECTDPSPDSGRNAGIRPINLTAHDLFEWFKRNAR